MAKKQIALKIKLFVISLKNKFFDALYPKNITCVNCGAELVSSTRFSLCAKCMSELPRVGNHKCLTCGVEINNEAQYCINCMNNDHFFEMNRSPLKYEGIGVSLIKKFKFGNKQYIADELAKMMCDEYFEANFSCDVVVAVPMSEMELRERGYNQSSLLAKAISARLNLPYTETLLKVRDTSDQKHLKGRDRRDNLKGVFYVADNSMIKGKTVLLIDDVFTTGATINECSRTLKKHSARSVYSLTACITQLKVYSE
ncbi:MAG: ComF family protein [Clostridia bacterium]